MKPYAPLLGLKADKDNMKMIECSNDMQLLANEWGFLPFFAGPIPGFSIEENIDPRWWFSDGSVDSDREEAEEEQADPMGAWDWKGRLSLRATWLMASSSMERWGISAWIISRIS